MGRVAQASLAAVGLLTHAPLRAQDRSSARQDFTIGGLSERCVNGIA